MDLSIYTDGVKKYTKDSFTSGIYRFTFFGGKDGSGDLIDIDSNGGSLNLGEFKFNENGWDTKASVYWIWQNSTNKSQHACAKFVRMALEAGGLSTNGRPNWAWKYVDFLPKIGFKMIQVVTRKEMNTFKAVPGDIAVYQKNNDPSVPGHICMWTGVKWVSDFKQNSMIVYQNTNEAYVFRFQR